MGAWGLGPFENDGAGDWLAALRHGDADEIETALAAVQEHPEYLEVDEGQSAIAAAQFVAAAHGLSTGELPAEVGALLEAHAAWVRSRPDLIARARDALARTVASRSEIAELWDESADGAEWRRSIARLDEGLAEAGRVGHG